MRVYTAPLGELGARRGGGRRGDRRVDLAEIERTVDRTRTLIALCALVAGLLAAGLATLLTRRALRPLTRLSAGARAIERSGDPAAAAPGAGPRDEVGELADTLNAMLASLERAQEAEHRFVGDASHELRTPLTALRGNAAYLAKHGPDPAVVADIEAGAERLGELLDDLLALAREDAAASRQAEPVALAELARRRRGDRRARRGPRASAPRSSARSTTSSATRTSTGRGRVTVTVGGDGECVHPRRGRRARARRRAGADLRALPRGPQARGEGSGLGLAIVRAIAERHGGRVEVDGARFTLVVKELSRSARRTGT